MSEPGSSELTVMVVDDHPMWRDGVSRDLEGAGFTVVATADPNAWRQAPLFVTPSFTGSNARPPTQAEHSDGIAAAQAGRAEPVDTPPSGDLFVARAGDGDRP